MPIKRHHKRELKDIRSTAFRPFRRIVNMLFDTPVYLVFLALVVVVYWRLTWRRQNAMLLAASYFFYGWWDWRFLLLMITSTVIDFLVARKIEDTANPTRRRTLLIASLVVNFSILGFFKYFNFFIDSTVHSLNILGFHGVPRTFLAIILPPGISFYTFQEVAYIIDVHAGRIKASRNFLEYGLFISLFPHLIAGPIQRPSHLLPQVQKPRVFSPELFRDGCMLILMGLVRKAVIADNCAHLANAAFSGALGLNGWATLIGCYAFAWQIYGDFSGYSDIARGSAQLLGFHFMVNFRQPYLAVSLQDFWRRWHISLSTWLRDYLYIPLGGNRGTEGKTYRNLLITMVLGGLWHGANWTFVVWGALHGSVLSIERWIAGSHSRVVQPIGLRRVLSQVFTFHVVCLSWIFFRAENVSGALRMIRSLGHFQWAPVYAAAWLFLAILVGLGMLIDLQMERGGGEYVFQKQSPILSFGAAMTAIAFLILFSANGNHAFIYFRF
jgi:alginate O-acetyltransferase complex protein AlgI